MLRDASHVANSVCSFSSSVHTHILVNWIPLMITAFFLLSTVTSLLRIKFSCPERVWRLQTKRIRISEIMPFGFPQTQRVCEITLQRTFHRHPGFNSSRAVQELSQTIQDLWRSTFSVSTQQRVSYKIHTVVRAVLSY